jgi:hypothetical protein
MAGRVVVIITLALITSAVPSQLISREELASIQPGIVIFGMSLPCFTDGIQLGMDKSLHLFIWGPNRIHGQQKV